MTTLPIKFNRIFIIQSLAENKKRDAGDQIFAEIEHILRNDPIVDVQLINVYDSTEFFNSLREILALVGTEGIYPYLHFEMHGLKEGLKLLSGDVLLWSSFKNKLLEINIKCDNNLYVSLSTCYGAEFIRLFTVFEPCPFFGYIGPTKNIGFDEALISYTAYFKTLLSEHSFTKAIKELQLIPGNEEEFQVINCLQYFTVFFALFKETHSLNDLAERYRLKKKFIKELMLRYPRKSKTSLVKIVDNVIDHLDVEKFENDNFKIVRKMFLHNKDYPELEII